MALILIRHVPYKKNTMDNVVDALLKMLEERFAKIDGKMSPRAHAGLYGIAQEIFEQGTYDDSDIVKEVPIISTIVIAGRYMDNNEVLIDDLLGHLHEISSNKR